MDGSQMDAQTAPAINWFHSLSLPGGESTPGVKSAEVLRTGADAVFEHGVAGKRVLDIGAGDGFFSFGRRCLEGMGRGLGFKRVEMTGHPVTKPHWRAPDLYWKHNRVFMHAWR